jgi:predicted ATPase
VHEELQTPEDYPVYCGMLVEMMAKTGEIAEGLALLSSATAKAEQGGHRYWLAELHRRRAILLFRQRAPDADVLGALDSSLAIAAEQNAVPILLSAYDALKSLDLSPSLVDTYRDRVEQAKAPLEPGAALIVDPEPALWNEPAK